MKFETIDMNFQSQDGMIALLDECKEVFNIIDDFGQKFLTNEFKSRSEFQEAKTKLSGCLIFLNPILSVSMTYKRNGMLHYFVQKKRETESAGGKFVAGAMETEAEESVAQYRSIRNIIQGYIWAAQAGIKDCESNMLVQNFEHKE